MGRHSVVGVAILAGFVVGACGGDSKSAAPVTTTTTTTTTTSTTTTTTTTLASTGVTTPPASNGGPLCDQAVSILVNIVRSMGGVTVADAYGQNPFHVALSLSLNDCASRIEWMTAYQAQSPTETETQAAALFEAGCDVDTLFHEAVVSDGESPPIPVSCPQ